MNIRRIKKQANKQTKTKRKQTEEKERKKQCRLSLSHKDAIK